MVFRLTILGSSSALPTAKRYPTAHLLNANERFFLIDCGEGTQMQLRKYKFNFSKINHIFISHLHGDHIFGLPGLLSTMHLLGRKNDLHIYGPAALEEILKLNRGEEDYLNYFKVIFHRTGHKRKNLIYSGKNINVWSIPLKHRVETTGFLFEEKSMGLNIKKEAIELYSPGIEQIANIKNGDDLILEDGSRVDNNDLTQPPWKIRSYAYISDTAYNPKITNQILEVDLLFHESTFENTHEKLASLTLHSTSRQAAMIAKKAKVGKLLLGHFSSRYKNLDNMLQEAKVEFENSFIVEDGDNFEIKRIREDSIDGFSD
ncbi:MAG: ribonuclease Z [Bacteroidales bacterium]|nr:ribonuclease Z [Bacteroidales bacterium]